MIACLSIPGFELRAALLARPGLARRPAALAPVEGKEPLLGPVTAAAESLGVRPGMRMGEALATCPALVLVEPDPAGAEHAWDGVLRRLEDAGFAVESTDLGCLYFDTRGVERLYGGVKAALQRALAAAGRGWDARVGAAERRFAALAAASVARPGQALIVADEVTRTFLAPLPLTLLPLEQRRSEELSELGVKRLGQLAGLPGAAVAERLGPDGRRAWSLARGDDEGRVKPRRPSSPLAETLELPEAVGNELTLRRALGVLLDRLLAREERGGRAIRKLTLSARLVGGGSWRRTLTLRDATAERSRLRAALGPKLADLPAPIVRLRLELAQLSESSGRQLELVRPEGAELEVRLKEGLRQVRASAGTGAVCTVVEVAPWSRIPEQRALLVPRDD
jgi:protein ImuB